MGIKKVLNCVRYMPYNDLYYIPGTDIISDRVKHFLNTLDINLTVDRNDVVNINMLIFKWLSNFNNYDNCNKELMFDSILNIYNLYLFRNDDSTPLTFGSTLSKYEKLFEMFNEIEWYNFIDMFINFDISDHLTGIINNAFDFEIHKINNGINRYNLSINSLQNNTYIVQIALLP